MKKKNGPGCSSDNCCDPCVDVEVTSWTSNVSETLSAANVLTWTNGYVEPTQHVSSSTHEAYSFKLRVHSTADITIDCEGVTITVSCANQTISIGSDTAKVAGASASGDPIALQLYACPMYVYVNAWNWSRPFSFTDLPGFENQQGAEQPGYVGTCLMKTHASPPVALTPRTRFTTTGNGTITPYRLGTDGSGNDAISGGSYLIVPETRTFSGSTPVIECGNGPDPLYAHFDHLLNMEAGSFAISGFEVDWDCFDYTNPNPKFLGFRKSDDSSWTPDDYFSRFAPTTVNGEEVSEPAFWPAGSGLVHSFPEDFPEWNRADRLWAQASLCYDVNTGGGTTHTGTNNTDDGPSTQVSTAIELTGVDPGPFSVEWSVTWTPSGNASNTQAEIEAPSAETYSTWATSDLSGSVARTDSGTITGVNPTTEDGDWLFSIFDTNADDVTLDTWTITIDQAVYVQRCGGLSRSYQGFGFGALHPELDNLAGALLLKVQCEWTRAEPTSATPYPVPTWEAEVYIIRRGRCAYFDVNLGRDVYPEIYEGEGTATSSIAINDLKDGFTLAATTGTYDTCSIYDPPEYFVWNTPIGPTQLEPDLVINADPPCDTDNDPQGETTTVTVTI